MMMAKLIDRFEHMLELATLATRDRHFTDAMVYLSEAAHITETLQKHKECTANNNNMESPCRQQSDESGLDGECLRCGAEQGEACREGRKYS